MIIVWLFSVFVFVPLIVHLFNFKKAKRFYFPTIKFINHVSTETKSKTRLKYYLVLSSRVLVILTLIFFLFTLFGDNEEIVSTDSLIYLDNSISMSNRINGITAFDETKKIISELIEKSNSKSIILTNSSYFSSEASLPSDISPSEIFSLGYSFSPMPLSILFNRPDNINSNSVFIFSDMQDLTLEKLSFVMQDSLRKYYFVVNDNSSDRNAFVDTVFIQNSENDFSSLILNVDIDKSRNFDKGNIVIKLLSNGKQLSSLVIKIEELDRIQFDIAKLVEAKYEIQLSGDDIDYDNSFFLTVSNSMRPLVSLITSSENNYLKKVFKNTELFDFIEMDKNSIDFSKLESSDLIILDNLNSIPNGILGQFDKASVLIFPSDSIDYLNGKSTGIKAFKSRDENQYRTILDKNNVLFQGIFESLDTKSILPLGSSLYSFEGVYEPLIRLSNGNTFLAKASNRNIYILSSPLDEEYTNLPVHGIFLPIMYRLAMNASNSMNSKISYYPNDLVTVEGQFNDLPVKMSRKEYEIVPEFQFVNNSIVLSIPSISPPGFYSMIQGTDTINRIAVNLSKSESIVERVSYDDLKTFFDNSNHVSVHKLEVGLTPEDLMEETTPSLWKIALILVFFFILTETTLHRYLK